MAAIASSTSVPMVGCGALAFRNCQRASFGTQKMLAARYSSRSSGSAPWAFCASSSACLASKASEMYLRKIRPRTTCLYSAASMLLRSASAAAQSLASKPRLAVVALFLALRLAIEFLVASGSERVGREGAQQIGARVRGLSTTEHRPRKPYAAAGHSATMGRRCVPRRPLLIEARSAWPRRPGFLARRCIASGRNTVCSLTGSRPSSSAAIPTSMPRWPTSWACIWICRIERSS